MVVEVARQVDDESRLLAGFDNDVQGLNAQVTVGSGRFGGQTDDCTELLIFAEPSADGIGVLSDGRRVVVGRRGGWGEQGKRHPLCDVSFDGGELGVVRARLSAHACDRG